VNVSSATTSKHNWREKHASALRNAHIRGAAGNRRSKPHALMMKEHRDS
jgi:hypothetical protein